MRRSDVISGGILVVFGLAMIFIVVPGQIDSTGGYGTDPRFFPVALLWLIVVMSILLVGSRLLQSAGAPDDAALLDRQNWAVIVGASLYLLIGFVALSVVGFIVGSILMIAVLMYLMGVRNNWIRLAGVSVAAPVFIYVAMQRLFTIQLP